MPPCSAGCLWAAPSLLAGFCGSILRLWQSGEQPGGNYLGIITCRHLSWEETHSPWTCDDIAGQSRFLCERDLPGSCDFFLGYVGFSWEIPCLVLLVCSVHILVSWLRVSPVKLHCPGNREAPQKKSDAKWKGPDRSGCCCLLLGAGRLLSEAGWDTGCHTVGLNSWHSVIVGDGGAAYWLGLFYTAPLNSESNPFFFHMYWSAGNSCIDFFKCEWNGLWSSSKLRVFISCG